MFFTSVMIFIFGIYVLFQENNLVSRSLFVTILSAIIWLSGVGILYLTTDTSRSISFYKAFTFLGVATITPGIYLLTVSSLGLLEEKKRIVALNYVIALAFYILNLTTDWLTLGVKEYFWGKYILFGPLSIPLLIFFFTLLVYSLNILYQQIRKTEPGLKRDQLKLLLISLILAALASADFLACYPSVAVYPFGYFSILAFISIQTYALTRYQKASANEIFRTLENGIVVVGRDNHITNINPAAEKITRHNLNGFIGRNLREVIPAIADQMEEPKQLSEFIQKFAENSNQTSAIDIYFREPKKYVNVAASPMMDRFGARAGNILVLTDITDRKRMEQELLQYQEKLEKLVEARTRALKNSEENYKALVEHAQVGIGIHHNGRMIFANGQLLSMLGYTRKESTGKPIEELIHPDEVKLVMSRARDRYQGKKVIETYDVQLLRKDGSILPAMISNARIEYQHKVATLITVIDTTETRLRKEMEAANKELEMFAYSVSHDLRAPLRSIDGFSQAFLEDYGDKVDEEGKDYLLRIRTASQRMSSLINDILQLSRLGRSEIRRKETDLSALAQDIAKGFKEAEPDRTVEFVIAKGITAYADQNLMRVVLENLIGNAWKFTQKHAHARIEFGQTDINGVPTYFIRDDGAGFDMKYADRLFAPFQRLHSEADFTGTGVGLASVQRIIHRHGGTIWVESAIEKGTTFYFTL